MVARRRWSAPAQANYAPLKMYGQEYIATTWAMANMNMIIHDLEGVIEIGDTFKNPKFRVQEWAADLRPGGRQPDVEPGLVHARRITTPTSSGRFPKGAGFPGKQSADWGWVQHILASLNENGRAADRAGYRRGEPRQRQRQHHQREAGAPVVCGQRPD